MTKCLIGVELIGDATPAVIHWLNRLALTDPRWEVIEVVGPPASPLFTLDPWVGAEAMGEVQERQARKAAHGLERLAASGVLQPEPTQTIRLGHPASEVLERAEEIDADLIAVQATQKSGLGAVAVGSVSRAIVEASESSLLITRGTPPTDRPLHAVLAVDHSEYLDQCLGVLAALGPKGIGTLTAVYARPRGLRAQSDALAEELANEVYGRPIRTAEEKTQALCVHWGAALGLPAEACSSIVSDASVNEAIDTALADADLLILGAKGHGLWERLTLGSVSYRQAIAGSKTTLVLRTAG